MKIPFYFRLSLIIAIIGLVAASCSTSNWPQFRGTDNNMVVNSKSLPAEWGNGLNIKWEVPLQGKGWSSPIIWKDKIFMTEAILEEDSYTPDTTSRRGREQTNPPDGTYRWMVSCLDLNSGDLIWEQLAVDGKPEQPTHRDNTYASESPVTDGKRVYAYFAMKGLFCYDLEGELIWKKEFSGFKTMGNWGTATSPVLYENFLYLKIDSEEESYILGLDKETGEEIWRKSREEPTTYTTPVIWTNAVRTELVTVGKKARSYDPETGELFWELDLRGGRSIACPVYNKNLLFTGNERRSDGGGFLFAVTAGAEGDITPAEGDSTSNGVRWTKPNSGFSMPSPVLYEGKIYIIDRRASIQCFEAATGNVVYPRTKVPGAAAFWASPWVYDGKLFCPDEKGTTHVVKTGPEFEVLSTNTLDDKFWSSLAVYDKGYIFRGVKSLYCIE